MGRIIIIAIIVGVACYAYSLVSKKKTLLYLKDVEKKTVDGVVSFNDVVGWFKGIRGLDKDNDIPFMANPLQGDCLKGKMNVVINVDVAEGKKAILLGVFNQKENKITKSCLLQADGFDDKTLKTFGDEPFVILN